MISVAIEINDRYRLSTRDLIIDRKLGGIDYKIAFKPSLLSAGILRSSLDLSGEGSSEISNVSVEVADPSSELYNYLCSVKYESIPVNYILLDNLNIIFEVKMTLSDMSMKDGVVSFDLRIPESMLDQDYMTMFTPVTFQWLEIPKVIHAASTPTWVKLPDPPWQIIASDYRRTYYHQRRNEAELEEFGIAQFIGMNQVGFNPYDAYESSFFGGYKKSRDYTGANAGKNYHDFITPKDFDRIPIRHIFRSAMALKDIEVSEGQPPVTLARTFLAKNPGYDVDSSIYETLDSKRPLFDNFRSYYYDFINNRFLQTMRVVITNADFSGTTSQTFNAGDTIPEGQMISIAGVGISLGDFLIDLTSDGSSRFDYKFAQIDSSIGDEVIDMSLDDTASPEIIGYLVCGHGAMWTDGINYWWMSGGPTPTSGIQRLERDSRPAFLSGIPTTFRPDPKETIIGGSPDTTLVDRLGFKLRHNKKTLIFPVNTGEQSSTQPTAASSLSVQKFVYRTTDRLFVYTSGMVPDIDNDPDYSAGFLYVGQQGKISETNLVSLSPNLQTKKMSRIAQGNDFKLFCRYKLHAVHEDLRSPVLGTGLSIDEKTFPEPATILELQIHNRPLDTDLDYSVNLYPRQGLMELPDGEDMRSAKLDTDISKYSFGKNSFKPYVSDKEFYESKLELYQVDFYLGQMKIMVPGLSKAERDLLFSDEQEREKLRNRRRGQRLDQVLNFQDLITDISSSVSFQEDAGQYSNAISVEEQNSNIINNASERYAVIKESYIEPISEDGRIIVYEYLILHIPYEGGYAVSRGVEVPDASTEEVSVEAAMAVQKGLKAFTNKMSYRPPINRVEDQLRGDEVFDYGSRESDNYFTDTNYRIMHDCIPQNAKDLGKFFPVVYGRVYRVPLIHAISNIALEENSETAGDDVYIYSSHQCGVTRPFDIVLEIDVKEFKNERESIQQAQDRQRSGILDQMVISPFPASLEGHKLVKETRQFGSGRVYRRLSLPSRIYNPYHNLIEKISSDGKKFYGIKLRGSEWDERAEQSDKRYPIRNGLGSTPVYATFDGYYDNDREFKASGGVLDHPADIIRHFFKTYGRKPYSLEAIDYGSCGRFKASTPNYKAAIYMTEQMLSEEFTSELCRQFGIQRGNLNGKIYLYYYDKNVIDYNKPIIDKLNVVESATEDPYGYQDYVTDVVYRYKYSYTTNEFQEVIHLNSRNDANLAKAASILQNRRVKEIDAKWVNDTSTAYSVARNMASLHSKKRRLFNLTIKVVENIRFQIGDIVPVTIERLTLNETPCIVTEVEIREDSLINLKLTSISEPS
jgi:hypothetical protein